MSFGKNESFWQKIVSKSIEYLEVIKRLENWDFAPNLLPQCDQFSVRITDFENKILFYLKKETGRNYGHLIKIVSLNIVNFPCV